jgi:hypothetical protein
MPPLPATLCQSFGFVADNLAVFLYDNQQLQVLGSRRATYNSRADGS